MAKKGSPSIIRSVKQGHQLETGPSFHPQHIFHGPTMTDMRRLQQRLMKWMPWALDQTESFQKLREVYSGSRTPRKAKTAGKASRLWPSQERITSKLSTTGISSLCQQDNQEQDETDVLEGIPASAQRPVQGHKVQLLQCNKFTWDSALMPATNLERRRERKGDKNDKTIISKRQG